MKRKETLTGPGGLKIELDAGEIFPGDPGAGTPALVVSKCGNHTATFGCAVDTGELDDKTLSPAQLKWLNDQEHAVDQWVTLRVRAITRDGREAVLAVLE